jgi:hypothetical protein
VKPTGWCSLDIADRTYLLAETACYASIFIYPEMAVSDEMFIIIPANDVGISIWYSTLYQLLNAFLPTADDRRDVLHAFLGSFYLLTLTFWCIKVKEIETYVRFGHDNCKGGIKL